MDRRSCQEAYVDILGWKEGEEEEYTGSLRVGRAVTPEWRQKGVHM
jgi:hypothetical protein